MRTGKGTLSRGSGRLAAAVTRRVAADVDSDEGQGTTGECYDLPVHAGR
jgi:hypothetical protein